MYKKLKINVISAFSISFLLWGQFSGQAQSCIATNPILLTTTDALTTTDVGQSFVLNCFDGVITSINVWSFTNNTEIDLYIYEGEGFHDMNPYYQPDIKLSAGTPLNNQINLTTPIAYTNGQKFTFRLQLTGGGSFQLGVSNAMNPYGAGRMYENGIPQPQEDLFFIVNAQISILPVELTRFEVEKNARSVQLKWQTATETNNMGFEIEKSSNGQHWENIGFVKGQGSTQVVFDYTFEDQSPYVGWNYYRLKQIDFDGKYEYTEIQSLQFDGPTPLDGIHVFPNPAGPGQTVSIHSKTNPSHNGQLLLLDATGKKVWENSILSGQAFTMQLPTALPAGLYALVLRADNGRVVGRKKILVSD